MIKTCIFPAAGYGTRFLPATKALPKEMLPILTKPLIHYGVEEALNAGMNNIGFITGRGKRALEDYFDISYELEHQINGSKKEHLLEDIRMLMKKCNFTYTRQKEMKGLGDAINSGKNLVSNKPFGVILADDLCINENGDGVMSQMVQIYKSYRKSIVAVMEVSPDEVSKYGVISGVKLEENVILADNMVEKPEPKNAPSNLAIIGRYILTPDIFEILSSTKPGINGEIQITDALLAQAKKANVIAYKFKGRRFDCGSIEGFMEATNFMYEKLKNEK